MPLYSYRCTNCEAVFDHYLPFSEHDKPVNCPDCKEPAQKQFQAPYVIWGQGWAKPMDWGKHDVDVCYPDGKVKTKKWNDLYDTGGL